MRNQRLYLKDIIEAMDSIERFVEGMGFEEFKENDLVSSAVIRKFEIIGEATKNVSENIKSKHPEIPWREMAGFRDKLIHFYFGVKYEIFWDTIKDFIPEIKPLLLKVLHELEMEK